MTLAEFKRRFAVGTRWYTEYLRPLRPENSVAPERTVTKLQTNGIWFSPAPWSSSEGFLDYPKARNISESPEGAITLSFDDGRSYVRYKEIK